ncbi:MAG: carbohydrate-binding family 9-like protein [Acidobacteriales bacterium]|nr:carbohydrate-binding family 9-like protein [Terriglobales bacterium]
MRIRQIIAAGAWALAAAAQTLPSYDIYRAPSRIVIDGRLDEQAWRRAPVAGDFHFNWWKSGEREQTEVRLLWDDKYLYAAYFCHDKHISASVTKLHGPVSMDDCVELFFSPNPERLSNYFGVEINAIGTLLGSRKSDDGKSLVRWVPDGLLYRTTFQGLPAKKDDASDDHWILEMAVPLAAYAADAVHTPPRDGDRWRVNLNRCGGVTNPQYSTWSPVSTPRPNFHVPESFGWMRFVNRKLPRR